MNKESQFQSIDKKIAQEMVNAYAEQAARDPKSYTKAIWFPADQILEMAKTIADGKHDGLRIYLAQYTADAIEGLPKDYEGRNTVLLVPTFAAGQTSSLGEPTEEHEDDLSDIGNRGKLCPSVCDGTAL